MCAEALSMERPFGGHRPLIVEFSPGLPPDCPTRTREGPARSASAYVWCAGAHPPETLVMAIREAGLPTPNAMLRVARQMQGGCGEAGWPVSMCARGGCPWWRARCRVRRAGWGGPAEGGGASAGCG